MFRKGVLLGIILAIVLLLLGACGNPAVTPETPDDGVAVSTAGERESPENAAVPRPVPPVAPEPAAVAEPADVPEVKPILEPTAPVVMPKAAVTETAPGRVAREPGADTRTCTLAVTCRTILLNLSDLNPDKAELVPKDGVILPARSVAFQPGENVFNILQREVRSANIHFEFVNTPMYDSAYIKGIHNLYEGDCGPLSGWTYKINGGLPSHGISQHLLQPGDVVEVVYSCDLGRDVNGDAVP